MSKRIASLAALVAVSLVPWSGSAAGSARNSRVHSLRLTSEFRALVSPTSNFIATGIVSGQPFGSGAIVRRVTESNNVLSVAFTIFAASGSVRGTATETRTDNADGSVSFTITRGTISGGTGAYRGARGTIHGSGKEPTTSSPVTETSLGTVKY
jgi:hypothetical protein